MRLDGKRKKSVRTSSARIVATLAIIFAIEFLFIEPGKGRLRVTCELTLIEPCRLLPARAELRLHDQSEIS
jgi:hypothetical protein